MADKLSAILQKAALNFGIDVSAFVNDKDAATRADFDKKIAALANEDGRVNGILEDLLKLSDAKPDSPEWDEGQNLYTLISENYVAIVNRTEKNEVDIKTLQDFATQTTSDISTSFTAVNKSISDEVTARKAEDTNIRAEIAALKSNLETKDGQTDQDIATINGKVKTLETAMTSRREEVAALQKKQAEYEIRITALEDFLADLSADSMVSEFRNGLAGAPSAFGHTIVPKAT